MKKILTKIFMSAMLLALVFSIAACSVDYTPVTPLASYTITVTGGTGSGVYNEGTSVTINATIANDQTFDGWYEGETLISSDAAYTFTASKDVTYAASFSEKYASLTITGGGYIQSTGATSGQIEIGEEVTIVTSSGSFDKTFECFLIGDKQVTQNPYTFTMGEEDVAITTIYSQTDKLYVYVDDGLLNGEEVTTATYYDKNATITISYQYPDEIYSYFDYWYYVDSTGEEVILSYNSTYTHIMTESIMIYTSYKNGYTVTAEDATISATNGSYFEIDNTGDDATAIIYEDCSATIKYTGTSVGGLGFIYWYTVNEDAEEVFLSYDKEYTFVVTDDMEIFAKYGDDTTFEVAITGGTIAGFASSTENILINREITVVATAGDGIFQGWTDGTTNADGTTNVLSYDTEYTFTVTGTTAIEASYANKLVITDDVVLNDIFYYDQDENAALNYFSFLVDSTADVLSSTGVAGVKLYAYTAPDNDRSVPAAEITVAKVSSGDTLTNVYVDGGTGVSESYTMTADGYVLEFSSDNGTKKLVTTTSKTGLMTFDGSAGSNFWTVLKAEAGDFGTSQKYYFAMQLVGETGYESSDISSCGRVGAVEDLTQRSNAATSSDVEIDTYTISDITDETNGSIEITGLSKVGETITVDATVATAGYEFFRVDLTVDGVTTFELTDSNTYTFTMPKGDVTIKASFKEEGTIMYPSTVTIVGGTIKDSTDTTATVETGESITATATYDTTNGTIFQNWTDGATYTDGTAIVYSYDTDCTYAVMGDSTLTTSYSNQLTIGEDVDTDYIGRYDSSATSKVRFMNFSNFSNTNGIFNETGVDGMKLYIYDSPDDTRDRYVATAEISGTKIAAGTVVENVYFFQSGTGAYYDSYTTTAAQYMFTFKGLNGEEVNLLCFTWSEGNTIYFEAGSGREIWSVLDDVIDGYSAEEDYYFAMQMIGSEGYDDSEISACSRVAITESGVKTNVAVTEETVTPYYYNVTVNGSSVNSKASEGETITLDVPTKEGYTFTGFESADVTINEADGVYTFTMPAGDVAITANYTKDVYTITNGTVSEYGSISLDTTSASYGDKVTITSTPISSDYVLTKLYAVDNDNIEFTLQDDGTYTFTMPSGNITVVAEYGEISMATITVSGGTISGVDGTSTTAVAGTEVTVVATEDTTNGSIFQGWTDGSTNADGTTVILSYDTTYTFEVSESVNLSASYSNQLVFPDYFDENGIFKYEETDDAGTIGSFEFLRFWDEDGNITSIFLDDNNSQVTTYSIKLYIYADVDADRDDYVATITISFSTLNESTNEYSPSTDTQFNTSAKLNYVHFAFEGAGETADATATATSNWHAGNQKLGGSNIYFGTSSLGTPLSTVIDGYSATASYYVAMQMVAVEDSGYADSEISSCSRIALTVSGTKTNTPVA